MKKLILLVYPRIDFEKNYPYSWLPYSVLSIASSLQNDQNIEILIFDQNRKNDEEFRVLLETYKTNLLCAGFSIMTGGGQIRNALHLSSIVKSFSSKTKIVFGGPMSMYCRKKR
jgi:hypothetical protein